MKFNNYIDKKPHPVGSELKRYFSGGGSALRVISNALTDAKVVRIATAYFEPSGFQCLKSTLEGKEIRILLGRPDTTKDDIEDVISDFLNSLTSGELKERTRAMEELRDALRLGLFLVKISPNEVTTTLDAKYLFHHAKLYMADKKIAVVCSSNMTYNGLVQSREAGIAITEPGDVIFFTDRFDEYFNNAQPIAEELLELLEEWLKIQSPFDIYIKSLLKLYGLPDDDEVRGKLPPLAGYQRPIVSRVLWAMEEYKGSMLVASTGLGKTIMAAHTVAYLRMKNIIDSVIILCPAGLKRTWQKTMRAARVSSSEFSYYILSIDDWKKSRRLFDLERELKYADNKTMIILDESHHLRNRYDGTVLRLRNQRIQDTVNKNAKILLMTATPYSRGIEDINSQLELLPAIELERDIFGNASAVACRILKASELSELKNCVVLTTPSVVKNFSAPDEQGNRYVKFSEIDNRYFPKTIHIKNISYKNPCDEILTELLQSGLLRLLNKNSEDLDKEDLFGSSSPGQRDALMEARIVHQSCSSVAEVDLLLGKMQEDGGFTKIRFEKQEELGKHISLRRMAISQILNNPSEDEKLIKVKEILDRFGKTKAVIFCVYRKTASYIAETLKALLPDRTIESTVDKNPDEVDEIIRKFAPIANRISLGNDEDDEPGAEIKEIDILVATGAMSEGFNLQDAPLLFNFDLPWTVLVLAQRMGRILRPWHEPREIYIFNLIPSTMENESIHHALNWKSRLHHRNREFSSFSDIPVLSETSGEYEMIELGQTLSRIGDTDLDLDQVIQFIEDTEKIQTTSFIDDLAVLTQEEIRRIKSLPPGFRSLKRSRKGTKSLYILFDYKNRALPALFDKNGNVIIDSEAMDKIMNLIRATRDEAPAGIEGLDMNSVDLWVEKSRNSWAAKRNIMPEDLKIICFMVLLPE